MLELSNLEIQTRQQTPRLNLVKIDWAAFRPELHDNITINNKIDTKQSVDVAIDISTTAVNKAIQKCTRIIKITLRDQSLPQYIKDLNKERNRIRREFQRNRTNELRIQTRWESIS